jgi:N,N'-diacetyllegionaminate synthase
MVKIIAEIGMNHDGSLGNAIKHIEKASELGANCVKFQIHLAEFETTTDAPMPPYFKKENRFTYFSRTSFSIEEWIELVSISKELNLDFGVSVFSREALNVAKKINVDFIKVPSGELTNTPLIKEIAKTKIPLIISTGMNSFKELELALDLVVSYHENIVIMQCTSMYPTPSDKVGLNVIEEMLNRYPYKIGLSDHTSSNTAAILATSIGISYIEKHFTLSKYLYGPDAYMSLDVEEFANFASSIREAEVMIDSKVDKDDMSEFEVMKETFEKKIIIKRKKKRHEVLTMEDLMFLKAKDGIRISQLNTILGRKMAREISEGETLELSDLI